MHRLQSRDRARRAALWPLLVLALASCATPAGREDTAPRAQADAGLLATPLFGVSPVPLSVAEAYTPGGLASARGADLVLLHEKARYTFARPLDAPSQPTQAQHPELLAGALIDAQGSGGGQDLLHALVPLVALGNQEVRPILATWIDADEDTTGGALLARGFTLTPQGVRLEFETRAVLRRDLPHVVLTTKVTNKGQQSAQVALGDRLRFGPGVVRAGDTARPMQSIGAAPWLVMDGRSQSYGYTADGKSSLRVFAALGGARAQERLGSVDLLDKASQLKPGLSMTYTRRFLASAQGAAGVYGWLGAMGAPGLAAPVGRAQLSLEAPYGLNPEDFAIDLYRGGHFWSSLPVRSGLVVDAQLPAGDYQARGRGVWDLEAASLNLQIRPGQEVGGTLKFPQTGEVLLRLRDRDNQQALAGTVVVTRADGSPAWLGPGHQRSQAGPYLWLASGEGTLRLPPGRYTLIATRGPEFSLDRRQIEVKPGDKVAWEASLSRVLTTPGDLLVDPQVYSQVGGSGRASRKVLSEALVCSGVEVTAVADASPRPGQQPLEVAVPALLGQLPTRALAPLALPGRFQAWSGQAERWPEVTPRLLRGDQITDALQGAGDPQQVARALLWGGSAQEVGQLLGVDPGSHQLQEGAAQVELLEVLSGDFVGTQQERGLRDGLLLGHQWLLRRGRRTGLLASSGASLLESDVVGLPATWVEVGGREDSPSVDPARVVEALRQGRTSVTTGPWLWLRVEGKAPGQLATARRKKPRRNQPPPPPEVSVRLEARAASWVGMDKVELLREGQVIRSWDVEPKGEAWVFRTNLTLPFGEVQDTWLQLRATGSAPLPTVPHREVRAYALTSPVYVDVNRDKAWAPPREP